jgi:membrane-bound lytic murein transglycosylase F
MRTRPWWLALLLIPVLAWAGLGPDRHVDHKQWPRDFDRLFRKYTKHYFGPHIDWHWFKAQGIAESGLNPKARSPVGAIGIMQIMPPTYREIRKKNPMLRKISEPRWNIAAAIFYDRLLYRKWRSKQNLNTGDRLQFAFGSYNAGHGRMLKAYRRAEKRLGKVRHWKQVAPFAPRETRAYVARIRRLVELAP